MLPLKLWYPIDVQNSPYYELAYFLQFFGQIMTAMVYANFGIVYLSECVLICGQFDILCCSLRNLRFTALLRRGFPITSLIELTGYSIEGENHCTLPEDEYNQYLQGKPKIMDPRLEKSNQKCLEPFIKNTDTKDDSVIVRKKIHPNFGIRRSVSFKQENDIIFDASKIDAYAEYRLEVMQVIMDCVHHHQEILDYCESFERFCSPISLVKMFQITLLTCFVMYSFSVSFQMTVFEYGTLAFWDLFLLCYFGNEVRIRSAMVAQVACSSPWHIVDQKTFKNLIPLILRASKPVSFTGGSFYMLNLENMIGVLKASFSYFTVLRNINEAQS